MKFTNNKLSILTFLLVALAFHFMRCGNQADRGLFFDPLHNGGDQIENIEVQPPTTLRQVIESGTLPGQDVIAKNIIIKPTVERIINSGVSLLTLPAQNEPWYRAEEFLIEMGAQPQPPSSNGSRVHVYSNKSVNGLRYINAGFNVVNNNGQHIIEGSFLAFEFEAYNGVFEDANIFLKQTFLGEDATPCFDNSQNHRIYKKDDYLVEVFEETADTIDLDSVYPPRTAEDIGSIKVSISKGGHPHGIEMACYDSEETDSHTHHPEETSE